AAHAEAHRHAVRDLGVEDQADPAQGQRDVGEPVAASAAEPKRVDGEQPHEHDKYDLRWAHDVLPQFGEQEFPDDADAVHDALALRDRVLGVRHLYGNLLVAQPLP